MGILLKGTARGISSKATEDIRPSSKATAMVDLPKAGDMAEATGVGMEVEVGVGTDSPRGNKVAEEWEWQAEQRWGLAPD